MSVRVPVPVPEDVQAIHRHDARGYPRPMDDEAFGRLSVQMWQEPLLTRILGRDLERPALTVLALLALRTEVEMGGLAAFVENEPAGFSLEDAIDACDTVGAADARAVLVRARDAMARHGITRERLRADLADAMPFEVRAGSATGEDVEQWLGDPLTDDFFVRLADYVDRHADVLERLLSR